MDFASTKLKLNNIKTYDVKSNNAPSVFKKNFYTDASINSFDTYEDIDYNSIDLSSYDEKENKTTIDDYKPWYKEAGATAIVGYTTIMSSIFKIAEYIDDGTIWVKGMVKAHLLRLFGQKEFAEKIENWTMDEIARDKIGEINKIFYENTSIGRAINDNSKLKYDSDTAKKIQNVTTEVAIIAGATAATIATGGATAPLFVSGFAIGAGQSAEKKFQDKENRNFWNDSVEIGIDATIKGLSTVAYGKSGAAAINGVKALAKNGVKLTVKGTLKAFNRDAIKTSIKTNGKKILKNTVLDTLKDGDTWSETAATLLDDVKSGIQTGEWNIAKMLKKTGTMFAINYFTNFVTNLAFDINTKRPNIDGVVDPNLYDGQPTDKIFDNDSTMSLFGVDDTVVTTPVESNSRIFNTYDEFVAANAQVRTQWEAGLTDKQKTLIKNYISESELSSYATMNGIARGTCINPDAGTVTFYHAYGTNRYTFSEYTATYGESVSDLYTRTIKESAELDAAIRQCRLPQDTIVARGMDANALSRFGIDINADSAETIMLKLGDTYSDAGFMSSTPVAGGGFTHKNINLIMDCPAGSACADFATFNPGEEEILFPMGQQFNVDNVVKKDGKIYIHMTLKGEA